MKSSDPHLMEFLEKLARLDFFGEKMVDKLIGTGFQDASDFSNAVNETPIFVLEQVAYVLTRECGVDVVKRLLKELASDLKQHPETRYFFVEALVAGAGGYEDQTLARSLIGLAPNDYRHFLNMRFGVS